MNQRILCVDDDALLLQACQRQLRKRFDVTIAVGAHEGLDALASKGPFAVVVSDMRMPKMDGVQFLARAREMAPDTVRIMLTGNADQQAVIDAINQGAIFRYLNKPCSVEELAASINSAIEHHRLILAERELLTKTLAGSVGLLSEVLSLTNSVAFGCGTRFRQIARQIAEKANVPFTWEIELAAMLAKLGCVALPEATVRKGQQNAPLSNEEARMLRDHPEVGARLISRIPRLEGVAQIVRYHETRFDGADAPADAPCGTHLPLGARLLKLALDCDALLRQGMTMPEAIGRLKNRAGAYDPALLEALSGARRVERTTCDVTVEELEDGMILAEEVRTQTGSMLLAEGTVVSQPIRERLKNFSLVAEGIRLPIRVRRAAPAAQGPTSHLPASTRAKLGGV